ncbi:hypothetical protein [Lacticaseibacillus rhamnosus]|uniref:hypothetical protein n=1 Tax=Lacticaseibacillus rhamnosus TaxID=47715 RepID=UPI001CDACA63|nr:hypothetical protein [Lacticaseibacillus rhamnosus]
MTADYAIHGLQNRLLFVKKLAETLHFGGSRQDGFKQQKWEGNRFGWKDAVLSKLRF